jgi:hypothetical protein
MSHDGGKIAPGRIQSPAQSSTRRVERDAMAVGSRRRKEAESKRGTPRDHSGSDGHLSALAARVHRGTGKCEECVVCESRSTEMWRRLPLPTFLESEALLLGKFHRGE